MPKNESKHKCNTEQDNWSLLPPMAILMLINNAIEALDASIVVLNEAKEILKLAAPELGVSNNKPIRKMILSPAEILRRREQGKKLAKARWKGLK